MSLSGESILRCADAKEDAVAVIVTIENSIGEIMINHEELELFYISGSFITTPVSLPVGNYRLTEFLVINENNHVIYLTPMEGSTYDYLVADPLPVDIIVVEDQVTKIVTEVITTDGLVSPEDFGYVTFDFNIVDKYFTDILKI